MITLKDVTKSYDGIHQVIKPMNLDIKAGEFVTLIGESGCGKTTLLKMINGLVKPTSGQIDVKGKSMDEWDLIELRRNTGYVIQQIGLFPHMTVWKNISYVLDIKNVDEATKRTKAEELIRLVGLDESYLDKYPRQLSGGQQQRVGVARALAADPDIILMDEPFGAVDEITRKVLQDEILRIHSLLGKTILFVTHDIEEAMKLGSRIILFNEGVIEQNGTREEMMFNPKSDYVKKFFGLKSFMAYLHVAKIGQVLQPVKPEEYQTFMKETYPSVNKNAPILEGVKSLFDNGLRYLPVVNDKGEIIGKFDLSETHQILVDLMKRTA